MNYIKRLIVKFFMTSREKKAYESEKLRMKVHHVLGLSEAP